eukprot:jgi/Psemu1/56846/gm1.56846_g
MAPKGVRAKSPSLADSSAVFVIAVAMVSFFAGTMFTIHMNLECVVGKGAHHFMDAKVEELAQKRVRGRFCILFPIVDWFFRPAHECEEKEKGIKEEPPSTTTSLLQFPYSTTSFATGMARTPKTDFFDQLDLGVPMDVPTDKDSDVLVLYNRKKALPEPYGEPSAVSGSSSIPSMGTEDALQNCDYVNVILANHNGRENICTAIVPQYESYHIQRWMRLGVKGLDPSEDLQMVSRGMQSNGKNQFLPP